MRSRDPDEINRLIGEFTDLQEEWERDPETFDWARLQELAQKGAQAYNEGSGPSFHALAIDGVPHGTFHERFLTYSVKAGFDPFKLVSPGSVAATIPAIDHASLAEAAMSNPVSARMRAFLMELAQARFAPLAQQSQESKLDAAHWLPVIEACVESMPYDLLAEIAPELAKSHHGNTRHQAVDPVEGYLSIAEVIAEYGSRPYG